jgi:hypothetical protein
LAELVTVRLTFRTDGAAPGELIVTVVVYGVAEGLRSAGFTERKRIPLRVGDVVLSAAVSHGAAGETVAVSGIAVAPLTEMKNC